MLREEIKAFIIAKNESISGPWVDKYPDRPNDNYSYIPIEENEDLLKEVLTHPEYSHWTHRNRYSVSVYFHDERSPTRVSIVASFDPSLIPAAYRIKGDVISAASYELYNQY